MPSSTIVNTWQCFVHLKCFVYVILSTWFQKRIQTDQLIWLAKCTYIPSGKYTQEMYAFRLSYIFWDVHKICTETVHHRYRFILPLDELFHSRMSLVLRSVPWSIWNELSERFVRYKLSQILQHFGIDKCIISDICEAYFAAQCFCDYRLI